MVIGRIASAVRVVHLVHDHAAEGQARLLQTPPEEDSLVDRLPLRCRHEQEGRHEADVVGEPEPRLVLVAFVAYEARIKDPVLPMRFFKSRGFAATSGVSVAISSFRASKKVGTHRFYGATSPSARAAT